MIGYLARLLVAWLRWRPRPSAGSCAEFDADPYRYTRSPWIKSLIDSPLFNENVPTTSYDVVAISHPKKRTGRLFIMDMLRLEKCLRFGSRGLYGTLGDNMTRAVYPEEFERLAAELRETCPDTPLKLGGSVSVAEVQQAAASVLDAARKVRR